MPVGATTILGGAPVWLWVLFHFVVFVLLGADFFLTRDALSPATIERRSYGLTGAWIAAALLFAWLMVRVLTLRYGLEYLTGYGIEEALSIDNLFVFLVLFRAFRLPPASQRRVLFFGVLGAILMRALMIAAGIRLLQAFTWTNYIFGAILIYTAAHLLRNSAGSPQERTPRWIGRLTRHLSVTTKDHETRFLTRKNGSLRATPLLLALIAIEGTDAVFATDSVPAVLAVSHHPFVVYSSNIFAVLGLRSLYFTLAAALERLQKLRYGLAAILIFVGGKMMLTRVVDVPIWVSMSVLATAVGTTVVWSLLSEPAAVQD
ncbi:MAG TPA: TerC/Alx family metal homeostasis membrane protein [Acidobacteriaceae bacterium]|nr:TerC/Alx family metal homeostasis membrane protein [Acidobacteriaceae bacterium]